MPSIKPPRSAGIPIIPRQLLDPPLATALHRGATEQHDQAVGCGIIRCRAGHHGGHVCISSRPRWACASSPRRLMPTPIGDPHGTVRILIVDDHPVLQRGLVDLVNDAPGLTVCAEAGNITDALAAAAATQPHVGVVDLSLGAENGLDLVATFAERHPAMYTLVLSGHDEDLFADRALRAGALGYIKKDQPPAELVAAVRRVASGKPYASAETTERILSSLGSRRRASDDRPGLDRLSDRERHVLTLLGKGLSTRDIAGQLKLSVKTIESHYAHLKEKLGARTGRELMRLAVGWSDDRSPLLSSKRTVRR